MNMDGRALAYEKILKDLKKIPYPSEDGDFKTERIEGMEVHVLTADAEHLDTLQELAFDSLAALAEFARMAKRREAGEGDDG